MKTHCVRVLEEDHVAHAHVLPLLGKVILAQRAREGIPGRSVGGCRRGRAA